MEYRRLGKTELKVSRIGFGCWGIGGHGYGKVDDAESIMAIRKAIDLGINLFDTAGVYGFGHSELILGKALGKESKGVIIATKVGVNWDKNGRIYRDLSSKAVEESLNASLRRLKVDCIQLLQVHWYDGKTPFEDIAQNLAKFQKLGKVMHIGISNFSFELASSLSKLIRIESNQVPYGLIDHDFEKDLSKFSVDFKQSIIAYNVLARGLLTGKYDENTRFGINDTRDQDPNFSRHRLQENKILIDYLNALVVVYGKSNAQVAIRWVLDNPYITSAIIGMKKIEQVLDNIGALEWNLEVADKIKLSG
jgi:aryl-alcohol dehydrogenase-like predicted oxidoreductase